MSSLLSSQLIFSESYHTDMIINILCVYSFVGFHHMKCSHLTTFDLQKLQLHMLHANTLLNTPVNYLHFKMGNLGTEESKNFVKVA